jgi:hypothetical protein
MSDLLRDRRALPFFMEWRSPRDRAATLPQLLLGVWRGALGGRGASDARGVIASASHPLGSTAGPGAAAGGTGTARGSDSLGGAAHPLAIASPGDRIANGGGTAGAAAATGAYGYLQPQRRQQLERIAVAGEAGALLDKVRL